MKNFIIQKKKLKYLFLKRNNMSWRSIEREKSLEAHNYHMRRMEQEKIKIEKERNIILNNIFVELSILVNNN
jgi:hypothetical protein